MPRAQPTVRTSTGAPTGQNTFGNHVSSGELMLFPSPFVVYVVCRKMRAEQVFLCIPPSPSQPFHQSLQTLLVDVVIINERKAVVIYSCNTAKQKEI